MWNPFCPFTDAQLSDVTFPHLSVEAISEVDIKGGSARATSQDAAPWTADKAFILGHANAWHNGEPYGMFPEIVSYEFPQSKTFIPARVSFRPRIDCCLDQGPTVWQFVGSNDENCGRFAHWTILCEDRSDTGYLNKFTTKYCDVDDRILSKFRCLGISVLRSHSKDGYASFKDVRMWEKIFP